MMKKTIATFCAVALLTAPFTFVIGQNKKQEPIKLTTRTDSLSYSLGQTITVGIKQYLQTQGGVLQDTATNALVPNYNELFETADAKRKAELSKELNRKKEEVASQNKKDFAIFMKGVEASLATKEHEKNTYNTGISIGTQLKLTGERFEKEMLSDTELNRSILTSSILAALNGGTVIIDNPQEYIEAEVKKIQEEKIKALHEEQIAKGDAFLAANKTKEGVQTLPSGIQYKIIKEGSGIKPQKTDNVTVHYEGKLLDGTIFDSSYNRGEPATFGVTQVIKGWTEILQIMPTGSKWTVYIPSDLAYGERDQGTIKPFSTLIFDIELLDISQ